MVDEWKEIKAFLIKIIIPSLAAISMKLAILSKNKEMTLLRVIVSFVTGVGAAYLLSKPIQNNISDEWVAVAIGIITISGEKIGYYVMFRLNIENILDFLTKNKK